jgi:spore coat polysaccharide biosynthesis protein SpsF
MEDGQLNKKVIFIIQARMKSTRLPGKILMPLPLGSGKPLLSWIIEELKKSTYFSKIVIASSLNKENDPLVSFCNQHNISCFRGNEDNVLSRFTSIIRNEDYECIVRLTADNPIIDVSILDNTIEEHLNKNNDYTCSVGLPVGMNFEIISSKSLLDTEKNNISDADKEHVTMYVRNNDKYQKGVYYANCNPNFKSLRLTVDYATDYTLVSSIISYSLINKNSKLGIQLVEEIFNKYPWIFESNSTNIQKKQFLDSNEEIKEACMFLKTYDFNNAALVLEKYVK